MDDREEWADAERFPGTVKVLDEHPEECLRTHPPAPEDYVVIVTHEHALDESLLRIIGERQVQYLGMIGSRGKWARFVNRLNARGVSQASIDRVHCPVGLDIGALTPAEIAVSITAQLINTRRGGSKWTT